MTIDTTKKLCALNASVQSVHETDSAHYGEYCGQVGQILADFVSSCFMSHTAADRECLLFLCNAYAKLAGKVKQKWNDKIQDYSPVVWNGDQLFWPTTKEWLGCPCYAPCIVKALKKYSDAQTGGDILDWIQL